MDPLTLDTIKDFQIKQKIDNYLNLLKTENLKSNLISRKTTPDQIFQLVNESIMLIDIIKNKKIIDAGSGNGLLGIIIAICLINKQVYLIESNQKKYNFLIQCKNQLNLKNINPIQIDINEFLVKTLMSNITLITRGFPRYDLLIKSLNKKWVNQFIAISTEEKFEKIIKNMDNIKKSIYNIPLRNKIKIFNLEYVSRET